MKSSPEATPRVAKITLALLPLFSFVAQWIFSARSGTLPLMFRHPTVMAVDWIFVPFNYFVVEAIDWRRGGRLFAIAGLAVVLNAATHAYWQYNGLDPGHMISAQQVVLPAGWVHLAFSTIETSLLIAFVFARRAEIESIGAAVAATLYFVFMAAAGYWLHGQLILSDAIVLITGIFFVHAYPRLNQLQRR